MHDNVDSLTGSDGHPNAPTEPVGAVDEYSRVPVHSAPKTERHIVVLASIVTLVLVLVFVTGLISRRRAEASLVAQAQADAAAPLSIEVAVVHRAAPKKLLMLPGEARAMNETTIYARTNGYISKWLVDIGDHVKQGQTLAIIDTPELDDQLNAARAKVIQAQSESRLADASASFAKVSYERWQSAAPEGIVSEQERDQKKSELDTSIARVAAADAQVKLDQEEVHRLQTLVGFKEVTAPFDGIITQRHIDIGDLVTAGSTTSTSPLFTVTKSDQLRIFVDVPQSSTPEVQNGMAAVVTAPEYPSRKFSGTVDRMSEALDRTSRTMRVEVIVPNRDLLLKPGGYLQVAFETDRHNPPLEVPASALAMRPDGPEVAVVASDDTVKFRRIQIAQDLGDVIEVASGLNEGEKVALNISGDVTDGERVVPHQYSKSPKTAPAVAGMPGDAGAAVLVSHSPR